MDVGQEGKRSMNPPQRHYLLVLACVLAVAVLLLTSLRTSSTTQVEVVLQVQLQDVDSGTTSPRGNYRWMDVADQTYAKSYQNSYNYTQAQVTIDFYTNATILRGTLTGRNLKPNFAYQLKVLGKPDTAPAANGQIGLAGRWWQEEWDGSQWTNGQNLNNKGDGSFPSPNDQTYFSQKDIVDATSPTGKKYRYSAYWVFYYFLTDAHGNATIDFQADVSYHVLWKTSQRARTDDDGPIIAHSFSVSLSDPVGAYDIAHALENVDIFAEWERLPAGSLTMPVGEYQASFLLTEESFHGSGLAGGWAAAMGGDVEFTIVP